MTEQQSLFNYCLRLGDDVLVQSYRLSEWCSSAPILEEDLALTNFALDMIGRAQALLSYAGTIEGKGRTDDDLAYKRGERQFYNHLITELPNGDFAFTIARILFISAFEYSYYNALQHSSDATLAAIAAKTIKEIKYHLSHASEWAIRLGNGTDESHGRLQRAVNSLWMYTGELFEADEVEASLAKVNICPDAPQLRTNWRHQVDSVLNEATVTIPKDEYMQTGSRLGIHTEHLGHILSEMQYLQRAYPEAKW